MDYLKHIFFFGLLTGLAATAAADEFVFDTCGAEGWSGPSSCDYEEIEVDVVGDGIQEWDVPEDGVYNITAFGAQAGGDPEVTGRGAMISGQFELNQGDRLRILVGQRGSPENSLGSGIGGGGGGGTFVTEEDNDILVIAGGGGVSTGQTFSRAHGNVGPDGQSGTSSSGTPGTDGGGGGSSTSGEGGAGYSGDGSGNAQSFLNGGTGGTSETPYGGFGGGGAGWDCCHNYEFGGGGGYSGGAGHESSDSGSDASGGGGSINFGENRVNESGANTGHGKVTIESVDTDFCNFRGPINECIMNQTNQLQEQQYNVSSIFESRGNAVFEAFNGPATLSLENTTTISGLWKGQINIESEKARLEAGAKFRPEGERIVIGE